MRLGCVFLTKLIEISPIVESWLQSAHVQRIPLPPKLGDQFSKSSCSGAALSGQKTEYGLSNTATEASDGWLSGPLLFGAAMAERNSECTGLLSQGTRGTLERSRDGFDARFVS
jgi:hypothetical protein